MWSSLLLAASLQAGAPCENPRVRDTAPLAQAIAQDRVMAQTFTKAATACAERGDACDQARLECATLLSGTIQKQVSFDEGQWLRDMLLPYLGASYPMTRTFGAAALASDASCNVDNATLAAAAQRRTVQATRRDAIFQEYAGYSRWAQAQLQKCKERAVVDDAKAAAARAEAERLAAASAAVGAAEALKAKQAQEAAAAKAEAERKAREAAEAEALRQKEAKEAALAAEKKREDQADKEQKRREEAERLAREERERDKKEQLERADKLEAERKKDAQAAEEKRDREKREAEARVEAAKKEAEEKQREAEAKRFVSEREQRVTQARATKERLVTEAEAAYKRAVELEASKKAAALEAVGASPAIAQAAVAEAAQAEKARVDAEKHLFEAKQKAESIVIDDSFERSRGSLFIAGGGSAVDTGFGLGVLGGAHFGFWGAAPPEGLASGFELRLWARYFGQVAGGASSAFDSLLQARYYLGPFAMGAAGELRLTDPSLSTLRGGAGPSLGAAFVDTPTLRVLVNASWLPVGNTIDLARLAADFEVSWRFLTFQVHGGSASRVDGSGATVIGWNVGGYVGARASW